MLRNEFPQQPKPRTFALGIIFEVALGFVGIAFAAWKGIPLYSRLELSFEDILGGIAACAPMLTLMGLISQSNWPPFARLRKQVEIVVQEMFAGSHWIAIALVSIAAGVGEEVLFRGALQPWIEGMTSPWIAIGIVGVLFGLAHAMSLAYFSVAAIIGFYLGWLTFEYDLVVPIVAHALYDFVALMYVSQRIKNKL